ncbi:MAG: hypothetical protein ACFFBR_03240 [Promethearchaeota archaeon]
MAGVIDHPLIQLVNQIVARTRPVDEQARIKQRLFDIVLYIKRVEGHELTREEKDFITHHKLGMWDFAPSKELAEGLRDRIRIIDEYQIESAFRIHEMLEYGFEITSSRTLTTSQVSILQELVKDPMMNVSQLSRRLGNSRNFITKSLREMEEHFALRRTYVANRGKLKFTLFSLFFRTKSFNESKALESWVHKSTPLFHTTLVFDVTFRNGILGFAIPSQQRAHRLFERRVRRLEQQYFERTHLHKGLEQYWNIRFDNYDSNTGQWLIPFEFENLYEFQASNQTKSVALTYCSYADLREAAYFDHIDLLLTRAKINVKNTIADIQSYLSQYHYNLSHNAISQRLARLREEEVIFPHLYFSGAGIEEFIALSIICNSKTQKELQLLASYFPLSFTYITQQGITIFVKRPTGWREFFTKFIHDLPSVFDIQELMVVYQERNYGSGLRDPVYNRWNEKRQYWEFRETEI